MKGQIDIYTSGLVGPRDLVFELKHAPSLGLDWTS